MQNKHSGIEIVAKKKTGKTIIAKKAQSRGMG